MRKLQIDFTQRPPYFTVDPRNADERSLSALLNHPEINSRDADLIVAIHDLCGTEPGGAISIDQLADRINAASPAGKTLTTKGVRKRLSRLEQFHLLEPTSVPPPAGKTGRPPTLYTLSLAKLPESLPTASEYPALPAGQLELFDQSTMLAELWDDRLRIDDFWCGLIASVLPITDKTRLSSLDTSVYYKKFEVPLQVVSRHGSRIPTIRSIKVIIALLSIVEKIVKQSRNIQPDGPAQTRFAIDLRHLLQLLQLPNKGGNRRTIIQYLREWEDTVFRFPELHPAAKEALSQRFGEEIFGFANHQLISQLCGIGVLRDRQKIPTLIGFQLPAELVERIAESGTYNLFSVTPAVMTEENPFAIALHLYCRKSIGHKKNVLYIRLRSLWQRIGRTQTYREFKHAFSRLVESKQAEMLKDPSYQKAIEDAKSIDAEDSPLFREALILGYRVMLTKDDHLAITVDLEDPYVGQHSRHAQLKQLAKAPEVGMNLQLHRMGFRKHRTSKPEE